MNEFETLLGIPFYFAIGLSIVSLGAFKSENKIANFIPWAAILSGIVYFVFAEMYYSQEEIIATVPIRVDLLFLPPLLLIPLVVGIVNLKNKKTKRWR